MITFFSIPKPFTGHEGVIQRNAVASWRHVHPEVEVILFGDEAGIAEASVELGARHIPELARNENGTPFLNAVFDVAQQRSKNELVCYVNGDIILFPDMIHAAKQVFKDHDRFLMVGRRVNLDVTDPLAFGGEKDEATIRSLAREKGENAPMNCIDYFLFPKGMLQGKVPQFLVGRPFWDNWMIWNARDSGIPVVDATDRVTAIHQNHGRSWHIKGTPHEREGWQNYKHVGSGLRLYSIAQASHSLGNNGLVARPGHRLDPLRLLADKVWERMRNFDLRKPSARR